MKHDLWGDSDGLRPCELGTDRVRTQKNASDLQVIDLKASVTTSQSALMLDVSVVCRCSCAHLQSLCDILSKPL